MDPHAALILLFGILAPVIIEGLHAGKLHGMAARFFAAGCAVLLAAAAEFLGGGATGVHLSDPGTLLAQATIIFGLSQGVFHQLEDQISKEKP